MADPHHEGLSPLYLQGIHSIIHKNFSKLNLLLCHPYMVLFVTNSSQRHIDEARAAKKESKAKAKHCLLLLYEFVSLTCFWIHTALLPCFCQALVGRYLHDLHGTDGLLAWTLVWEIVPQKFWINNCSFRKHINSISCLFGLHSCYELAGIIFTCNLNKTASLAVIDNSFLELLESWQNSQGKLEDEVHKKPWQL